jgi:hypothetical protein
MSKPGLCRRRGDPAARNGREKMTAALHLIGRMVTTASLCGLIVSPAYAQPVVCDPTAPLSDAWQHAEALLTRAFLNRGDIDGAQRAHDFVWQEAHAAPLPERWDRVEGMLIQAYLDRGDIDGAQRVRAYVLAQMHDAGVPMPTCPPSPTRQ